MFRRHLRLLGVVIVSGLGLVGLQGVRPAAAIPRRTAAQVTEVWTTEQTLAHKVGLGSSGMWCPTTSRCLVAWTDGNGHSSVAITADSGVTWDEAGVPNSVSALYGVSCGGTNQCVAVGNNGLGLGVVIFTTNGGSTWMAGTVPNGVGTLYGVSCPSSNDCTAVGVTAGLSPVPVILMTSNGGVTWASRTLPPSASAQLDGVSCPSISECIAVGLQPPVGAPVILATTDGGVVWAAQDPPNKVYHIGAISCASVANCVAIGSNPASIITTANGGATWVANGVPGGGTFLSSVYCDRSMSCVTVGSNSVGGSGYVIGNGGAGGAWVLQQVPSGVTAVRSVACTAVRNCQAIATDSQGDVEVLGPARIASIAAVTPTVGPTSGGLSVQIRGSAFNGSTVVDFGSDPATSFTVDSDTEITAVAPAHAAGAVDVTVTGPGGTSAITAADTFTYATLAIPAAYHPVDPARICDTRAGGPKNGCSGSTSVGPAGTLTIDVAGNGGVPQQGATSVVANVTVTDTTAGGYLTVYPAGQSPPVASSVNWSAHETVANLVTVGLSAKGAIAVYNAHGVADVVVDVEGYFASAPAGQGLYDPLSNPARICDTRPNNPSGLSGTALSQCEGTAPASQGTLTVAVAGLGGLPQSGVAAAVLNVTAVDPTTGGYLTVYPADTTQPLASNVNYRPAQAVPNRVVVRLDTQGKVTIFASSGAPQILVDVAGYYTDGSNPSATGSTFTPALSPLRICDTRTTVPYTTPCTSSTLGPNSTLDVAVAGTDGIPAGVRAVVANVTVTNTTISSYLTVYPSGQSRPTISDLNWQPPATATNLVITGVGGGKITVFNARGLADVIVDVVGWYA